MDYKVVLSKTARKSLRSIPKYVIKMFDTWVDTIENEGYGLIQATNGYWDHALKGNRKGQRSSSLTRSWRVIYKLEENLSITIIEVLEINNHDY